MKNITKFIIYLSIFFILIMPALSLAFNYNSTDPLGICTTTNGVYTVTKNECEDFVTYVSWEQTGATNPAPAGDQGSNNANILTPAGDSGSNSADTSTSSSTTTSTLLTKGLVPLVPCDKGCGFNDFMALINKVIKFILYGMVIPIAAIMFAYSGFLMFTAGGEAAGARTRAKSIFFSVVWGLIIAVAAFLIIRTILSILGYSGSWIGFNPF